MFTNKLQADTPRTLDRLEPEYYVLLQVIRQTLVPKAGYKEGLNAIHQTVLHALAEMLDFDLVDLMIGKMEDVICDSFAQRHALPYAHFISRILSQLGGVEAPRRRILSESPARFEIYRPVSFDDARRGSRAFRAAVQQMPAEERAGSDRG